jgi:hypothetical protein
MIRGTSHVFQDKEGTTGLVVSHRGDTVTPWIFLSCWSLMLRNGGPG